MSETIFDRLDGHRVSKIIYGTIIVLVVIITLEDHPPSALQTIAAVLGATIAVAMAELYSELIGKRVHERRALTMQEFKEIGTSVGWVLVGSLVPLPILLLALFNVFSVETALSVDKWLLIGLLIFYGYGAAVLAGSGRLWAIGFALLAGSIGAIVVLMKAALAGH